MTPGDLAKAVIAAAAGTFVGWAGAALTLTGRVTAIENTLGRIESRLDTYVMQQQQQEKAKP